jgi:putative ABC transport system permease protein
MPPGFSYPSAKVQLWVPTRLDPSNMVDYWGGEFVPLIGRLRPGANLAQAQTEIHPVVSKIRRMFPFPMKRDWNANATAISLQEDLVGDFRSKLLILFSSVCIVLLIACANVASLLLSRATVRRKEIALRAALGAGRARIVRQLLTESVLLSVIGGGLGILLGTMVLSVFRSVLPPDLPGLAEVRFDPHVLGFVGGLAVLTGLAFGIAPAMSAAQIDLTETIKTGSQRSTTHAWTQLRSWLIGGELALTVVLVMAAGLLIKSLYALSQQNPGFRSEHILTVRISPNQSLCRQRAACIALYNELTQRARSIPGVSDVAIANHVPLDGELPNIPAEMEGHPFNAGHPTAMLWAGAVTPDYLQIMHIPLLGGRSFTAADGPASAGVVLITASTAKHFWPGENAVGKRVRLAGDEQSRTVVGVVGDVRQYKLAGSFVDWLEGAIYMPYPQSARYPRSVQGAQEIPAAMNLLVKTSADPLRVGSEIRRLAMDQNPNAPVGEVQTMEAIVSASILDRRSTMGVFISFALAAIVLAAVGIYGLVSYSVSQRTYEIGVRMAIGATKGNVVTLILGQSLKVAALGVGVGIVAAILLTRFLSSLLYGVTASDPLTFSAVIVLLLGIAVTASCVPAWRAAQINPTKSLRVD